VSESPFEVLDARFEPCVKHNARLELHFEGCRWAEGPVYLPASRQLVWSDVPSDRMWRWDEMTGQAGVFREPSQNANGNTVDLTGRLITCEQAGRRVTRTEYDGSIRVIADRHDGRRFNSPNDVVVRSDGSIWFSDPTYGIDSDYEGRKASSEIGASHVYRVEPSTGACTIVGDDFVQPNGLAFSLDERRLYVSDTGGSHVPDGPRHIRVFDVGHDGRLSGGAVFAECTSGAFDGFRLDDAGRIWASAGDGVHCYEPDGTLTGKVLVPETVANVAFGGPKRNRLFICATTSLYSVLLPVNGAPEVWAT
jgi:gluconolactonase